MKWPWLIAPVWLMHEVQAVNLQNPYTFNLEVSADIVIPQTVSPGISVVMDEQQSTLNWSGSEQSFASKPFQYRVYLDTATSSVSTARYKVGLRDINLYCATAQGHYQYRGVDTTRKTEFGPISVRWSGGTQSDITTIGKAGDVTSPAGQMRLMFSPEYGREVPGASGSVQFQFPWLDRELADGGATCTGGALLLFYSEL